MAKLKPEWLGQNGVVKLPDHSAAAFDLYAKWLYCRAIPLSEYNDHDDKDDEGHDPHASEFCLLTAVFVLGEALLDDAFKNTVISAMFEKVRGPHGSAFFRAFTEMAKVIYEATPTESRARSFLVDVFERSADAVQIAEAINELPYEFHCDLTPALALSRDAEKLHMIHLRGCDYHDHWTWTQSRNGKQKAASQPAASPSNGGQESSDGSDGGILE